MPIPKPNKGEKQSAFISRCISAVSHADPDRDKKQIQAMCFDTWQRSKKDFNVEMKKDCISFVTKHYEVTKDGIPVRFIEVPISGLKEDRDGEKMSEGAIKGMINTLQKGVPLHSNHGKVDGVQTYSWQDIMGTSVDGVIDKDMLIAKFRLNRAHPEHEKLWSYLIEKMPVGFSIGAKPLKSHYEEIEEK